MSNTPTPQAWEQRPDEPHEWFMRFERFRLAGPRRALLTIYNDEKVKSGGKKARSIPVSWRNIEKKWLWRERAAAWDNHELEQMKVDLADDRADAQQVRRDVVKALNGLLARVIMAHNEFDEDGNVKLPITATTLESIARSATMILKESRLEFGEPTEITDTRGKVTVNVTEVIDKVRRWEDERRQVDTRVH